MNKHEFIDSITPPDMDMLALYKRYRKLSMDIVKNEILKSIPKDIIKASAKKLGFYQNKSIAIESERNLDILFNYVVFHYVGNGHKIIDRFLIKNKRSDEDAHDEYMTILNAFKNRGYGLLFVNSTFNNGGVDVTDILNHRQFLLMDEGLSMSAPKRMVIATEYLHFRDFAITTGAALPINACAKEVLSVVEKHVTKEEKFENLSIKSQSYIATRITKLCVDANVQESILSFEDV